MRHARRHSGLRRLDQKMDVVRHQAVGENPPLLRNDDAAEQREVQAEITVAAKDRLLPITARKHMLDSAGKVVT
jgi:hypothetical protein